MLETLPMISEKTNLPVELNPIKPLCCCQWWRIQNEEQGGDYSPKMAFIRLPIANFIKLFVIIEKIVIMVAINT